MSSPLALDDAGQGDPWVLLHSFPIDRRMWASQREALASSGRRVVAVDLPGFGGTLPLTTDAPSLDGYVDALLGTLDHLGLDRVTVLGLSLGGYVALRLAARAPERLRALVLADTRAAGDSPETRASRVLNLGLVRTRGPSALIEKMLPHLLAPGAPEPLKAQLRQWASEQSAEGVTRALLAMRDRQDASGVLPRLRCPTLLVVGAHDGITPPAEHHAMAAAIGDARVAVIEGAGHLSNLERPDEFNRSVLGWAAEAEGRP